MTDVPWYFWLVAVALLGGAWWLRKRTDAALEGREAARADRADAPAASSAAGEAELVAVIAAAVAAASGLDPSQFRIAGISAAGPDSAAGAAGAAGGSGWSTPLWGRVERFAPIATHR